MTSELGEHHGDLDSADGVKENFLFQFSQHLFSQLFPSQLWEITSTGTFKYKPFMNSTVTLCRREDSG